MFDYFSELENHFSFLKNMLVICFYFFLGLLILLFINFLKFLTKDTFLFLRKLFTIKGSIYLAKKFCELIILVFLSIFIGYIFVKLLKFFFY